MPMRFPGAVACLWMMITGATALYGQDTRPAELAESYRLVDSDTERVTILENGLTVILKTHRTAPVVSVRMYCRTGSIYEQEYLGSGMSHLFEHLLHSGETTTRTEKESSELLNAIGGNTNAYTTYDATCYYINTSRENLSTAVSLLGDWITRPTFPQAAFEREWGVVQRELERDLDNPDQQLQRMTMTTLFREHPVRYPVIGYKPVVSALTRDDIVGYYQRMYVPDNIVVCIVGDLDLDEATAAVCREFASFTRKRVPTIVLPEEPEMTTPRTASRRMNIESTILRLAWPSIPLTHPDLYALDLLAYVLTEGDSSRLARTVRDQGLVYSIDSFSWTPAWARGVFAITARLDPGQVQAATRAIEEQIAILQRELISEEELRQAQQQKAAEHIFAMQTAESVAEMMAQDFLATGDIHFSQAYVDGIQKVTAEQVREMARKYLEPARMATIAVLPEGTRLETGREAPEATPGKIHKLVLDNGLRVLVLPDPTSPVVAMQSFSLGGVLFENEDTNGLSRLAAMLAPRGTKTRTAEDIARFFDSRGGSLNGASGTNTIYFQSEVLKKDFAEALEVFADVVCNPTFPSKELENIRPQALDQIRQIDESWRSELMAWFQSRLFQASPYRFQPVGSPEVVASATREQIARMYNQCVTGPNTVLAIFGDVQVEEVEPLVRRLFAGLSSKGREIPELARTAGDVFSAPGLYVKRKPPERRVAGVAVGFPGMVIRNTDDVVAMAVLDTIISGYRYPTGWLFESLRGGNRSLVYEVHALNVPGLLPGYFGIYAACQPEQVQEVYRIITEQLDRARAGRFTPEELERARSIIVTTELMEQQTNSQKAMQAALDELYGLGYDYRPRFIEKMRAVTGEDVHRVAEEYLTRPVVAVVTPEPAAVDIGMKPVVVEDGEEPVSRGEEKSQ